MIQKITKDIEQNTNIVEELKVAAEDVIEVVKAILKIIKDTKDKTTPQQTNGPLLYAIVVAGCPVQQEYTIHRTTKH